MMMIENARGFTTNKAPSRSIRTITKTFIDGRSVHLWCFGGDVTGLIDELAAEAPVVTGEKWPAMMNRRASGKQIVTISFVFHVSGFV